MQGDVAFPVVQTGKPQAMQGNIAYPAMVPKGKPQATPGNVDKPMAKMGEMEAIPTPQAQQKKKSKGSVK